MIPENLAIIFGLSAAMTWGAGDFFGGLATKKHTVYLVVFLSHIVGGLLMALLALIFREPFPPLPILLWGMLAGLAGMLGVLGLYSGLARGRMGIVAPLTAVLSATIPILLSFFVEGIPPLTQFIGFGLALAAVWLLSGAGGDTRLQRIELWYAAVAGTGFAFFFIFIDQASETAVFWPVTAARVASVTCMGVYIWVRKLWERPLRENWSFIVLAGFLDALGNAFFALSTKNGRLDLASVLASLYPASTVMLAQFFLQERMNKPQWVGVLFALGAVILITL